MSSTQLQKKTQSDSMLDGRWFNQHNSEIQISVHDDGLLRGFLRIEKSMNGKEEYPLTGFFSGDAIAFCVRFDDHNCVTAWSGHIADVPDCPEEKVLVTLWQMSVGVGHQAEKLHLSIFSGADNFVRQPNASRAANSRPSHPLSHPKQ